MKTKIVYVLTSNSRDYYLEQTYLSVWSLKQHCPKAHVTLLTDDRTNETLIGVRASILEMISEKIVVKFENDVSNMRRSRFLKTTMRNRIEGDLLYIDGDTIINDKLDDIDNFTAEIGAILDSHRSLSNHYGLEKLKRQAKVLGFDCMGELSYYNGGVMYAKDCDLAKSFFEKWHYNWEDSCRLGINLDQPALLKTNKEMNHPIQEMDGKWNCQLMYGVKYYHEAIIIHYFASRYSQLNGGYIHQLMDPIVYESIKKTGKLPCDLPESISNPFSMFSNNLEIIGGTDVDIINTHVYKLVRKIYISKPVLFNFFQKILFTMNKFLKSHSEI